MPKLLSYGTFLFRLVRSVAFQILNFSIWGLALTNIFTEISENVALSFLDFMAFPTFNRSRGLEVGADFLFWGVAAKQLPSYRKKDGESNAAKNESIS